MKGFLIRDGGGPTLLIMAVAVIIVWIGVIIADQQSQAVKECAEKNITCEVRSEGLEVNYPYMVTFPIIIIVVIMYNCIAGFCVLYQWWKLNHDREYFEAVFRNHMKQWTGKEPSEASMKAMRKRDEKEKMGRKG